MTVTYVTPAEAGVKVGDYFYASWGYDQTNIDFWKVVGLTPKGIKVQKWQTRLATDQPGQPYHDKIVPGDGPVQRENWWDPETGERLDKPIVTIAPIKTKRIQMYGTPENPKVYANWTSYASMSKWDGTPKYRTGHGFGH